jgi:transcriptional regulator with XRE-family HTH domain
MYDCYIENMEQSGRSIPYKLRSDRKTYTFSQDDVAFLLDLKCRSVVAKWEAGICIPEGETLMKLCLLYHTIPHEWYRSRIPLWQKELNHRLLILKERKQKKLRSQKI